MLCNTYLSWRDLSDTATGVRWRHGNSCFLPGSGWPPLRNKPAEVRRAYGVRLRAAGGLHWHSVTSQRYHVSVRRTAWGSCATNRISPSCPWRACPVLQHAAVRHLVTCRCSHDWRFRSVPAAIPTIIATAGPPAPSMRDAAIATGELPDEAVFIETSPRHTTPLFR